MHVKFTLTSTAYKESLFLYTSPANMGAVSFLISLVNRLVLLFWYGFKMGVFYHEWDWHLLMCLKNTILCVLLVLFLFLLFLLWIDTCIHRNSFCLKKLSVMWVVFWLCGIWCFFLLRYNWHNFLTCRNLKFLYNWIYQSLMTYGFCVLDLLYSKKLSFSSSSTFIVSFFRFKSLFLMEFIFT